MSDDDATTDGATASEKGEGHTALVYFHGMGSQRRYEETSRLIDAIDTYLTNSYRDRHEKLGIVARIRPHIEPDRTEPGRNVTYIQTRHVARPKDRDSPTTDVRFYEAYWAPIMAGTSSPQSVAFWILRQSVRPFQTICSLWRARQRLRRSALVDYWEQQTNKKKMSAEGTRDVARLLRAYTEFDRSDERRKPEFEKGDFASFLKFIGTRTGGDEKAAARLTALAQAWHRHYVLTEIRNAFLILTILLALGLVGGILVTLVLSLLTILPDLQFIQRNYEVFRPLLEGYLSPTAATAGGLVITVGLALGMGRFLSAYMGDVEAWATYEETEEKHRRRKLVIATACDLMRHVLGDDACKRVIVVAHSLGTSIAHDTLLELARRNMAVNEDDPITGLTDLTKIRHFVTIASPIDKINYFFESQQSAYRRFIRVVETLRGDISRAPFAHKDTPHVHWVNFWDEADIISGALHSPIGRPRRKQPDEVLMKHRVDNVHVSNLGFPAPGRSHAAYFENREVISKIFEMTYHNAHSFEGLEAPDAAPDAHEKALLGPGERTGRVMPHFFAMLALPWLVLVYIVVTWLDQSALAGVIGLLAAFIAAVLGAMWLVDASRGNRNPL